MPETYASNNIVTKKNIAELNYSQTWTINRKLEEFRRLSTIIYLLLYITIIIICKREHYSNYEKF